MLWLYAGTAYASDYLLFSVYVSTFSGAGVCNQRDRDLFQGFDADYWYFPSGRSMAHADYVGSEYAGRLSVGNEII